MTPHQQTQAQWAKFDEAAAKAVNPDTAALILAMRTMTEILGQRLMGLSMALDTRNNIAQAQLTQSQKPSR